MKKIFRTLHLWLSVPFGLLVSLICFSGAMLVFENEITEWSRPDLYQVKEIKAATGEQVEYIVAKPRWLIIWSTAQKSTIFILNI